MAPRSYTISPPTNPVLQVLYFLLGGILLIGAVLIGAVILAFALGLALVAGIIVYARLWWLKRKLARSGASQRPVRRPADNDEVLEVEYTVVKEREERNRRD